MRETLIMIPAYNEEDSIAEVIEQVMDAVPNADILVINDGSIDQTEKKRLCY
jgi:glycosyltransferase involved in cell wall biosynthesis